MKQISMKEYHENVLTLATEHGATELAEKAEQEIIKLEEQRAKRQANRKNSEKFQQNEIVGQRIIEILQTREQPMLARELKDVLNEENDEEFTTQRISAILRRLVDNKKVTQTYPTQRNKPGVYSV